MSQLYPINCYFCKQSYPSADPLGINCSSCKEEYELHQVNSFYTTWSGAHEESINIKHLLGYGVSLYMNGAVVSTFTQIIANSDTDPKPFQPMTTIYLYNQEDVLINRIRLNGSPFTLENVKKKLSIYLTFS